MMDGDFFLIVYNDDNDFNLVTFNSITFYNNIV